MTMKTLSGLFAGFLALLPVTAAHSQVVGEVGVDWIGNDIVIEAIADPKIKGRDLPCDLFRAWCH